MYGEKDISVVRATHAHGDIDLSLRGGDGGTTAIKVCLVGGAHMVMPDGSTRDLDRKTAAAIFLAAYRSGQSRERVAGLLWPKSNRTAARSNLRVLLHRLHAACGTSILLSSAGWSLDESVSTDLLADGARALTSPLLQGLNYDDLEELRIEIKAYQEHLWARCAADLIVQGSRALETGMALHAASAMLTVLQVFPTDEAACRLLMRAQAAQGQTAAALASYERLRVHLAEELGVAPDPQTRQLQLELLRLGGANKAAHTSMPDAALALNSLPVVGRLEVVERISGLGYEMRHVWLEGEAGVGKSRVVDELMRRTQAVRVRCRAAESTQGYGLLARVVGTEAAEQTPNMQARFWMQERALQALQQMRRDGVIQIVIEDVHYIDELSARLFVELADAIFDDENLMLSVPSFVFTARSRPAAKAARLLHAAATECPAFERIHLRGLTHSQTGELAAALAEVPGYNWLNNEACVNRLFHKSGGVPLFAIELVRAAQAMPNPAALEVRVHSVEELLNLRLETTSHDAKELACLVAVAQNDFDPRMPLELLGQDGQRMVSAWRELACLGLFHERGFRHELAFAAVLRQMVAPQMQLLSANVADFLERHGYDAARVQHHRTSGYGIHGLSGILCARTSMTRRSIEPAAQI